MGNESATGGARPRVVETHISLLFFVGDQVYKLRKSVALGFLDFRERTEREADCHREVALNRRLAPDVYQGVVDVALAGKLVDHLVVMRRLPEEQQLANLARAGAPLATRTRQVAATLARFHEEAGCSQETSSAATGRALRRLWRDTFTRTDPFVGPVLDPATEQEVRALAIRWIDGREPLLSERMAAGRVRDGHGDLQADDVYCLDDGIRVLDCLEFSDRLRYGDVCADVASLVTDLERLGRPEAAARFATSYQELSRDWFPTSLLDFYCGYRAYVRSMVACLAPGGTGHRQARRLQSLALHHLERARVRLVLIGGLPGSGKSTIAAGIGRDRGWVVLRSDEVRRELAPGDGGPVGYREGRYRPEVTRAVYAELLARADVLLHHGQSVVLDATWTAGERRREALSMAQRTSSDLVELYCETEGNEAVGRLRQRVRAGFDASEATPAIRTALDRSMDEWPSATVIDTSRTTPGEAIAHAEALLVASTT